MENSKVPKRDEGEAEEEAESPPEIGHQKGVKLGGEQRGNQEFRFWFRQCRYLNFWQEKAREFVIL